LLVRQKHPLLFGLKDTLELLIGHIDLGWLAGRLVFIFAGGSLSRVQADTQDTQNDSYGKATTMHDLLSLKI
jgi:hypothetical protein